MKSLQAYLSCNPLFIPLGKQKLPMGKIKSSLDAFISILCIGFQEIIDQLWKTVLKVISIKNEYD